MFVQKCSEEINSSAECWPGKDPSHRSQSLALFPLLSFGVWHVSLRWGPKAPAIVGPFCTSEYIHVQPISRASEEGVERLLSYRAETSGSPEADDLQPSQNSKLRPCLKTEKDILTAISDLLHRYTHMLTHILTHTHITYTHMRNTF